jgi:hypothetical protein
MPGAFYLCHAQEKWEALLHVDNMPIEAESRDFYLTVRDNFSIEREVAAFKARAEQEKCRFPARYMQLAGFNASGWGNGQEPSCTDWLEFKHRFFPDTVFLAYAGPYVQNPSSALGHVFIVLSPQERKPSSFMLYPVVNYAADVGGQSRLEVNLKGIKGSLLGRYTLLPFHEKVREYSDIENRDLWLLPVRLTDAERLLLVAHLYELQKQQFYFRIHDKNCAYQTEQLLSVAAHTPFERMGWFSSPLELIMANRTRWGSPVKLPAADHVGASLLESLEDHDCDERVGALSGDSLALLLGTLHKNSMTSRQKYSSTLKKCLDRARVLAVDKPPSRSNRLLLPETLFSAHPLSMVRGGGLRNSDGWAGWLGYRALLHAFSDPPGIYQNSDEFEAIAVNLAVNPHGVEWQSGWLFNQSSLPAWSRQHELSWRLGLGGEQIPSGQGWSLAGGIVWGLGLSDVLGLGWRYSAMLQLFPAYMEREGKALLFNPEFRVHGQAGPHTKISLSYKYYYEKWLDLREHKLEYLQSYAWNESNATVLILASNLHDYRAAFLHQYYFDF